MPHPLVDQLDFTRSEWQRGLEGISAEDGVRHLGPMNCVSWTVGHLAWQEQRYFLERAQGELVFPELNTTYAYGAPMSTPLLSDTLRTWRDVIQASRAYLDSLTTESLQQELPLEGKPVGQSIGSALRRMTYHYWYHIGEIQAVRQMLGHAGLPEYVGDLEELAPYRPER
ncbi:MAG TPA: DinB family protein [Anaerolineales bacterium]|nr:DinB family protein [Anaerolineales bacterium]